MDIDRKLASVRRISAIDPIEGADRIVCVSVDGWKLVSDIKNGFKTGDLVIYMEIDSFLPVRPEFEWMRDRCYRNVPGLGEGFRVKTIKLRGQVSQGIIVPMSDFLEQGDDGNWYAPDLIGYVEEGCDLTDFLGVKKYEKPIPINMQGRTKGNFPSFIRKTDEERVQNCWGGIKKWMLYTKAEPVEVADEPLLVRLNASNVQAVFDSEGTYFLRDGTWFQSKQINNPPEVAEQRSQFEATLKLDGSSLTIYQYNGQFGVCSRNLELKRDPENPFWKAALKTGILGYLAQHGHNLAFQGELMGPGVQNNREALEELRFYLFTIFDIDNQRYFTPVERHNWLKDMGELGYWLTHVPVLNAKIYFDGQEDIDYFLEIADNTRSVANSIAEGIVFKSHCEDGPSFKIISNKFLLKEKD